MRFFLRISSALIASVLINNSAYALSSLELIKQGIDHYDTVPSCTTSTQQKEVESGLPLGSKIYVLGDSITNQSKTEIQTKLESKKYVISKINADPGRAISKDTSGTNPSGLAAVTEDSALIGSSDAVIIALGTNSGTEDLNIQIPALIDKVRSASSNATIYWVNLFYKGDSAGSRNALISKYSTTKNYKIIDTTNANIELGADNVHPTATGSGQFAQTIADGINVGGSEVTSSVGGSDILSLGFPNFPNEQETANKITEYIKTTKPQSPWLGIDANIGAWLMRESKTRGINPMLIVTIGRQENGFGSSNSDHVKKYHNYFGMKGSGPVVIPGSQYRGFASPSDGIRFFMDKIKQNTQGTDRGMYKDVLNFYDYLSMHQSGTIKYPGEPLGNQGPTGQDGFDSAMQVYVSWTTTDHPNNVYDGNLYNPGIYYKNAINLINELTGLTLSTVPSRGGGVIIGGCQTQSASGSSGKVDPSGYSFPLEPQNKSIGGIGVNWSGLKRPNGENVHHDGTAAFDLFSRTADADVYALYAGEVDYITTNYGNVSGCTGLQLKAADGMFYYYGHLKNPVVTKGQSVKAGDKLAEIADASFGRDCIGSAPHLHIDRGCVIDGKPQTAGRDECRDVDFIEFLSKLYAGLGN